MPKRFWLSFILLLFSVYYLAVNAGSFRSNPFSGEFEFSSPYRFVTTADNVKYVIDNGKQRVLRVESSGEVAYTIQSEQKKDMGPECMQNIAADESGNLYVHFYVQDTKGLFTVEEYIARYDSTGGDKKVIYSHKYSEPESRLAINWAIVQLRYSRGNLSWVRLEGDKVLYSEYKTGSPDTTHTESLLFKQPDALSLITSIDVINNRNYAYITRQGNLYRVRDGVKSLLYSGDSAGTFASGKKPGEISVPGWVQITEQGPVYMLDIRQSRLYSFSNKGERSTVFTPDDISASTGGEFEMFYRFAITSDNICLTNGSYLVRADLQGKNISAENSAIRSGCTVAGDLFLFAVIVCIAVSLVIIIRDFYIYGLKRTMPRNFVNITGIIVIMIVTMIIAINVLMPNFDKRYMNETENRIKGLTQGLSSTLNGDVINRLVNRQSDFYNGEYKKFRARMIDVFGGYNKSENSEFYFIIYKNYGGELAALMTQNDSYTPFQTYDWLISEEDNLYLESVKTGEIYTEKYSDSTGDWIYAIGPIKDSSGKVTAVIEIGKNFYAFNMENRAVRKNVIIEVITAIILVLMIFIEISLLSNVLWSKKRHMQNSKSPYDRVSFSRFLGFLYEFTFSLPLGFIPVYAIKLLEGKSFMGMTPEMAGAFPITLSTSGIVIGTIIAGIVMPKLKWRKLFVVGLLMAAAGLFLTGLSTTFIMFTLMMFFTGIGRGLLQMAARGFINTEENPDKRGFAFSNLIAGVVVGINVGVVIGGQIADHVSYRAVFFASALIIPLVIMFILFVIEKTAADNVVKSAETSATGSGGMSLLSFLSKPMVWGFFLLICVPNAVAYMFLQYTFLIVAEGAGFTTTDVGRAFILNGMAMFYLGPLLYSVSVKKIGLKWTMISSIFMWSFSLLVFAFTGNITGAIITIFIMGISEGYGNGAVYIFYTDKIKEVNEYGVEKALAVNEFMTNIGLAAGPIIFGAAMLLGIRPGMLLIAVSMTVLAVIFFVMHAVAARKQAA
ncbi:MAG TPA: MFS transporter [Spirochaetota bacterium]|nr:MFS transporter [Spirochaetota bacterium]HRX48873.1 MFS transporter [Spirochaetota bacterium]